MAEKSVGVRLKEILVIVCVVFSLLLSLYSHLQGLLFLPLSVFVIYRILMPSREKIKWLFAASFALISVWLVYTSIHFHDISCDGYPALVDFWSKMTLRPSDVLDNGLILFIQNSFEKYSSAFMYHAVFDVRFLPPISHPQAFYLLNELIYWVLLGVMISNALAVLVIVISIASQFMLKKQGAGEKINERLLVFVLISAPTLALLLYDKAHNFYRSIYINFLLSLALVILFSALRNRKCIAIAKTFSLVALLVAGVSLVNNWQIFQPDLRTYAGPSIPMATNWRAIASDVDDLKSMCDLEKTNQSIIVDDTTYALLNRGNRVFPITYLSLQRGILKLSVDEVLKIVDPGSVVAHCSIMEVTGIGWPADHKVNGMCCSSLKK